MVSYGHIRIKNAPIWESDFGGTAPMVEQTGVIGVTDGIYNDMIAYSKTSETIDVYKRQVCASTCCRTC